MSVFKMPVPVTIMGRSSSITNSFVNGVIPCIDPTEQEIDEALGVLGMTRESICCAYCGGTHTEWDHLNPLVVDKSPTGYISEIHNLVPACGKCNQSKGNHNWKEWMLGSAKLSPRTKGISDLSERVSRLEDYEKTFTPVTIDFAELVGQDVWEDYWNHYDKVIETMKEAQVSAYGIKTRLRQELGMSVQSKSQTGNNRNQSERRNNNPLPITLIPAEQSEFKTLLLQYRKATIEVHYANGYVKEKT